MPRSATQFWLLDSAAHCLRQPAGDMTVSGSQQSPVPHQLAVAATGVDVRGAQIIRP